MLIMAMKMCAMIQLEERQRGEGGEDRGGAPPSIANTAHDVHREEGPPDGGLFTDFSFHRARQANVEATVANVEGEIAGLKQKMEKTVTMSRVESIARGIAARKIEEMMKNMAESQVISTNVRLFVRA